MQKYGIVIKASCPQRHSDDMMDQLSKNNNLFCGFNVSNKMPDNAPTIPRDISRLFDDAKNTVAWTPPEDTVKKVVEHFLTNVEPNWLQATVRRDPALYKHMDLSEQHLNRFLKGKPPVTLADLISEGKLHQATVNEITNEVKTYQGLHAIAFHHVAHALYNEYNDQKAAGDRSGAAEKLLLARQISQGVRRLTAGIEIHPGAAIGKNFFIDHGAGVVIGETCNIGDDVFLYHDITLGATSRGGMTIVDAEQHRHPQVGNNVVISTGVKILGPTHIGNHVSIAANATLDDCKSIGDGTRIFDCVEIIGTQVGGATIGEKVKIGAGAKIIGKVHVGDGAVIGNGVTITKDVPAGAHVVGSISAAPFLEEKAVGELVIQQKKSHSGSPFTTIASETLQQLGLALHKLTDFKISR